MTTQRRSYETGHQPKCLVIVDDTAEWDRAVYYASRWSIRVGGGVVMLRIVETEDQNQQWLGVADIMRAEAHEAAEAALDRAAGRANGIAAITPERVIREGAAMEQLLAVIDEDPDIAMLVLAASPGAVVHRERLPEALADFLPDQPGQHVAAIARRLGNDEAHGPGGVVLRERAARGQRRGGKQDRRGRGANHGRLLRGQKTSLVYFLSGWKNLPVASPSAKLLQA